MTAEFDGEKITFITHTCIQKAEREGIGGDRGRERAFYLLVPFPNGNSCYCVRLKLGARYSIQVSHTDRVQGLGPSFTTS